MGVVVPLQWRERMVLGTTAVGVSGVAIANSLAVSRRQFSRPGPYSLGHSFSTRILPSRVLGYALEMRAAGAHFAPFDPPASENPVKFADLFACEAFAGVYQQEAAVWSLV